MQMLAEEPRAQPAQQALRVLKAFKAQHDPGKIFIFIKYKYIYTILFAKSMEHYPEDDVDNVATPKDSYETRAIRSGYTGPKNKRGQPDTTGTDEIGVMIYPPNDGNYKRYSGQWKNGTFEGHGTVVFDNDDTYTGDFKNSILHGHGVYTYSNGQVLDGEFFDDVIVRGKHECPNYTFQGSFVNGNIYEGDLIYADGTKFKGIFKTSTKRVGTYMYTNGDVFSGTFDRDRDNGVWSLNGDGKMIVNSVPDKYIYKGQTRNGVRHGKGNMYINGETYSATFENNHEMKGSRREITRGGTRGGTRGRGKRMRMRMSKRVCKRKKKLTEQS